MTSPTLADKLLQLHRALDHAAVPHAFGGAIALAYCTGEPRGTVDIDLNLFVAPSEAPRVFDALPPAVVVDQRDLATTARDGQVRLFWSDTPLDLFFGYHPFHAEVAGRLRTVPFGDGRIPVLSCEDLVVFKAFFARTRDWADIEAMAAADTTDLSSAAERLAHLLGPDHESYRKLLETLERPSDDGGRVRHLP